METQKYLLRIEAKNLSNSVYDTTDLSTIRGGGLRALECATLGARDAAAEPTLQAIYTGASQGLFLFSAANDGAAESVRGSIYDFLCETYPEQTISVEYGQLSDSFQSDVNQLSAKSNWTQMQSPSLVFPGDGSEVCHFDRIRPAGPNKVYRKGAGEDSSGRSSKVPISSHSLVRREHGIGNKHQEFYEKQIEFRGEFASDFGKLSDYGKAGKLDHKIAVIYLDGNGFGKLFRQCVDQNSYQTFSNLLKGYNQEFLREALERIDGPIDRTTPKAVTTDWHWSGYTTTNSEQRIEKRAAIRLETLLWGGDEIIWVVPAWQGWRWLQDFFQQWGKGRTWDDEQATPKWGMTPLRFGAGVVFCHHDAPIHDITRLARELADKPKEVPTENLFAYQVLESFDSLGARPFQLRNRKLPACLRVPSGDSPYLVCPGNKMGEVGKQIRSLQAKLPRSRVHEIVNRLCNDCRTKEVLGLAGKVLAKNEAATDFAALTKALFDNELAESEVAAWIHLNELWDYITDGAKK